MWLCVVFLAGLACAEGYIMPLTLETGNALENIIAVMKGTVKISFSVFRPSAKYDENASYWRKILNFIGFSAYRDDEPSSEPIVIVGSVYVFLILISIVCFYVLFAKHYFATMKASQHRLIITDAGDCGNQHRGEFESDGECNQCKYNRWSD